MAAQNSNQSNNYSTKKLFDSILIYTGSMRDYERIQDLLRGTDIDVKDSKGFTPLLFACLHGAQAIITLLISSGANVDCCDEKKRTVLHYASENNWVHIVRSLAKKVHDLNARDIRGDTALHCASRNGHEFVVKCLVEEGADLDPKNIVGFTPLVYAAQWSNMGVFDRLLSSGAKVDGIEALLVYYASKNLWVDNILPLDISQKVWTQLIQSLVKKVPDLDKKYVVGETDLDSTSSRVKFLMGEETDINTGNEIISRVALLDASIYQNLELLKWLVKRVPDLNARDLYGRTALHEASYRGNLEMVKYLVEEGADINAMDETGQVTLHEASSSGFLEVVKFLVTKGANINSKDGIGQTALHEASKNGNLDVVKYLLEKGANINVKRFDGATPLLCAAEHNHKDVVDLLMYLGAHIDSSNEKSLTMLHFVSMHGWVDVVESLVKKRCDLDARGAFGLTALYCACISRKLDTAQALLQAGASWDVADMDGNSPLNYFPLHNPAELKFIALFIESGAYLTSVDYNKLVKSSSLKVLQDVNLCCQAIINNFNNHSLPELYKLIAFGYLPPIEGMKIKRGSGVAKAIEQTVEFEIQTKGHCNILKVQPIGLSLFSVGSILKYCKNKKPELQNNIQ